MSQLVIMSQPQLFWSFGSTHYKPHLGVRQEMPVLYEDAIRLANVMEDQGLES